MPGMDLPIPEITLVPEAEQNTEACSRHWQSDYEFDCSLKEHDSIAWVCHHNTAVTSMCKSGGWGTLSGIKLHLRNMLVVLCC